MYRLDRHRQTNCDDDDDAPETFSLIDKHCNGKCLNRIYIAAAAAAAIAAAVTLRLAHFERYGQSDTGGKQSKALTADSQIQHFGWRTKRKVQKRAKVSL